MCNANDVWNLKLFCKALFPHVLILHTLGAVAMTSIDYGFFMVGPQWDNIEAEVAAKKAYAERERWRSILHYDEGSVCPQLRQVEHCDIVVCDN